MKKTLYLMFFLISVVQYTTYGQKSPKTQTIYIQTSAECGDCKNRIEDKLNYTKGVLFAELDLETKKATVKYKTKKLDALAIKQIIAKIGYDADEVKAKKEDVEKLPKCCQPGGMNKK
jgi:periplasmic mercuric ion binding protein